ncbi:gfo/Idh/MocA family oxidoreductase [Sphingobacterium phlebotomi]|uniref:Gfo/Idh/MocA family oxidoreductase n=1 Tax=Sphingobacterium phlebotomi TaxID=2605433 RepID=A0A5D4H787_9SPHI|nr:Gfo/Idh/MocA family oxidoreductase [Sphingobacterium phlebotomi]TYR36626.1 gfo/Idh/MocA family oxidoreductase [Sphingobacterium phlebotomi]
MKNLTRRDFLGASSLAMLGLAASQASAFTLPTASLEGKRIGVIGLDTSHSVAFAKSINENPEGYRGYKVVAAYPYGTKTIPSATDRIPKFTKDIQQYGVKITKSIKELLKQVDFVLLETNDGRLHLEQAEEVFKANKVLFIDKPLAASYADAQKIFALSEQYKIPFFSSSSLRYIEGMQDIIDGKYGKVLGADVYTPAALDPSHPDFFWYGIHGVEMLFAAMGTGCKSVSRTHTEGADVIVGMWEGGRIGTVRGTRQGKQGRSAYGGTIFCEKATVALGAYNGYNPLLEKIVDFFDTKVVPFDGKETLEICAFIETADVSKFSNGRSIDLNHEYANDGEPKKSK